MRPSSRSPGRGLTCVCTNRETTAGDAPSRAGAIPYTSKSRSWGDEMRHKRRGRVIFPGRHEERKAHVQTDDGSRSRRDWARLMSPISRGFRGRRSDEAEAGRVPPGQYVTHDFPVLSAGPTPHKPIESWSFEIRGEVDEPRSWTWEEFTALPSERVTVDIHCVTKWSKLDTSWTGVSLDTLLDGVDTSAEYVLAFSDGGYTTNLPLEDVRDGKAWVAYEYDDEPLDPEHGGPGAAARPASLLLEEREVGARDRAPPGRPARVLGGLRLPQLRRPVERTAVRRRLTWQLARVVEVVTENARTKSIVLDAADWPGHLAGQHVDVRLTAEDGYQAQRSYSIASAPEDEQLVLTVERLDDGEVSPYLTETLRPGRRARAARPDRRLLRLAGVARRPAPPRRRRLRRRPAAGDAPPPPRDRERRPRPAPVLGSHAGRPHLPGGAGGLRHDDHADARAAAGLDRAAPGASTPSCSPRSPGRRRSARSSTSAVRRDSSKAVADALVALGHDPTRIRTERFGPT